MGQLDDLDFRIEQWDPTGKSIEMLIAASADLTVARAAFDAAVKRRPGEIILLRQKTRVIAQSFRDE
jgi:uncharacterized SAM-dependent methyltransferase